MSDKIVWKFIRKYLFIFKAVSEGWIVRYIGGDKFEFYNSKKNTLTTEQFVKQYTWLY